LLYRETNDLTKGLPMQRHSASKWFGILSIGLALTAEAGCGGGSGVTVPTASKAPRGVAFEAGEFGHPCSGDDYEAAGTGWAFCDNGEWAYTTTDPGADGFTEISPDAGPVQTGGGSGGFSGGFGGGQ
jgi:hypothetical protein